MAWSLEDIFKHFSEYGILGYAVLNDNTITIYFDEELNYDRRPRSYDIGGWSVKCFFITRYQKPK